MIQWESRRIPTDDRVKRNILVMAKELDKIREDWGSPILVTSWYRPPAVNEEVGGAAQSKHLTGRAVDIKPANGKMYQFRKFLNAGWNDALGEGSERGFIHIDNRSGFGWHSKGKYRVRWNY